MSLTKRYLESNLEFAQQPEILLETVRKDIRQAAWIVDQIENLSDVTFRDLETISRNLYAAEAALDTLADGKQTAFN